MQSAPRSRRLERLDRANTVLVRDHELARADLPLEDRSDQVERTGLRRNHRVVAESPEDERTEPERITNAKKLPLGQSDDRRGSLETSHRSGDRLVERALVVGDQRCHHLRVGARGERLAHLGAQLLRIDEIAVVPERNGTDAAVMQQRLRVRPRVSARGRVARVGDRQISMEARQAALVEHLRNEAEIANRRQPSAVADGDACRLLSPVLQCVQPEVAQARDVATRRAERRRRRASRRPSSTTSCQPGRSRWRRSRPRPRPCAAAELDPDHSEASRSAELDAAVRHVVREQKRYRSPRRSARAVRDAASRSDRVARLAATTPSSRRRQPRQPTTGVGGSGRRRSRSTGRRSRNDGMPAHRPPASASIACSSSQPISSFQLPKLRRR